jgi:hypothetical protein
MIIVRMNYAPMKGYWVDDERIRFSVHAPPKSSKPIYDRSNPVTLFHGEMMDPSYPRWR